MSIKAMNWAWEQKLSPSSKLILMAIADAADEEGDCWPKVKTIAKKCGVSDRTVQRVLKEFVSGNLISVTPRFSQDRRQVSNNYRLNPQNHYPDNLSPPQAPRSRRDEADVAPGVPQKCQGAGDIVMSDLEPPHDPSRESISESKQVSTFPKQLTLTERQAIDELLKGRSQAYIEDAVDALTAALEEGKIHSSRLSWFRGMLRRKDKAISGGIKSKTSTGFTAETEDSYRDRLVLKGINVEDAKLIASKTFKSRK
ncbi:helix-turn-helix domain-containing protein [Pseudomonas syringae]|uniref:helix-turn-helix domain-containing protein n=1 Tax=Pseudomonas syringae TaxID=317 RepID=UPI000CDAD5C0|nr:helix-turn-helix domain-containing protein [Pseudomonas syringae]POP69030.1 hypothetical protein CXB35_14975 [Pseudomonas syringae]